MPLPIHQEALERQRSLMPQIFDNGRNEVGQSDENSRRRMTGSVQTTTVTKAVTTPAELASAPRATPAPPLPTPTPDRDHKFATSQYGGYIWVSPVHDAIDSDPFPNSGWPLEKATAATIALAAAKAVQMLQKVKQGRVAILVRSSVWNEGNLTISSPGIDLFGLGRPQLSGHLTITPEADTSIYDFDLVSHGTLPTVSYQPTLPPLPNAPYVPVPPGLYNCRVYGGDRAAWFQRRVYCENSQFFQTMAPMYGTEHGAIRIETLGPNDIGWSKFFNCQIYSYLDTTNVMTWGVRPAGFAVESRALAPGPFYIDSIAGDGRYTWPTSGVLFEDCQIHGEVLCEQWMLKFRRCYGISANAGPEVGGAFLRLRGQPLFDPYNFYYGDATAFITLEHCEIHARLLAEAAPWHGFVIGNPHPGRCDVFFLQSELKPDWNAPIGGSFFSSGGIGFASIVQSAGSFAAPATWITSAGANWVVVTFGDCPANAIALADIYTV